MRFRKDFSVCELLEGRRDVATLASVDRFPYCPFEPPAWENGHSLFGHKISYSDIIRLLYNNNKTIIIIRHNKTVDWT